MIGRTAPAGPETSGLPDAPKEVLYTFGNHFHWVDMQWLWGYDVLGRSVDDMLAFIAGTGARGNINFDVVGYEKMAAEQPEALERLRRAVASGEVEPVGCTYGQPYPLFHHAESALRQLSYGVRGVSRLLGVRPKSFWEEEFYFFPQLPQMLRACGFEYASLFFQWTWHTPHVPVEEAPAIWWEGIDGSRILTAPRTSLNLHQWPEDFEAIAHDPLLQSSPAPIIQQWLELLPSPDWMCRSELLLPGMKELESVPGITLRPGTLSEVLDAAADYAVVRRYSMDDVFHGMSMGRNGDRNHRRSRRLEQDLLSTELLSVLAGHLGRPYPHWDAYPQWELEECWRELLAFQHHDNDECEGLCGHVGYAGLDRADAIHGHVRDRTVDRLARRVDAEPGASLLVNPLGWSRTAVVQREDRRVLVRVPAAGFAVEPEVVRELPLAAVVEVDERILRLARPDVTVDLDRASGTVIRLAASDSPEVHFAAPGLGNLRRLKNGTEDTFDDSVDVSVDTSPAGQSISVVRTSQHGDSVSVTFALAEEEAALDVTFHARGLLAPDGRQHAALATEVAFDLPVQELRADTQYAVHSIEGRGRYLRKYPTGEWMTSPQEFEDIVDPFTALQLVDIQLTETSGLLMLHDGSQGFFRTAGGVQTVLSMKDPWDEEYWRGDLGARLRFLPRTDLSDAARWQRAQEFTRPVVQTTVDVRSSRDVPPELELFAVTGGPMLTAAYRESNWSAAGLPGHVSEEIELPTLLRLVEFDGRDSVARLVVRGTVADARLTDALGTGGERLAVEAQDGRSILTVPVRAHGIVTVALDLVEARKQPRNLDDHREVWATVHHVDEANGC